MSIQTIKPKIELHRNKNPSIRDFARAALLSVALATNVSCTSTITETEVPYTVRVGSSFVIWDMASPDGTNNIRIHGGWVTKVDDKGVEVDNNGKTERVNFGQTQVVDRMSIRVDKGPTSDSATVQVSMARETDD